jgi:hypothetical protein
MEMENSLSDNAPGEGDCSKQKEVADHACETKDKDEGHPTLRDEEAQKIDDSGRARNSSPAMDPDGEIAAGANSKKRKKVRQVRKRSRRATVEPESPARASRRGRRDGVGEARRCARPHRSCPALSPASESVPHLPTQSPPLLCAPPSSKPRISH